ncbi:MAG: zf-HC2 domain-containing protein [Desulfomonile tiedjei]|nr:zf-HC2 domain-containing protein [Desulfomonile tiedjei]
MTTPTPPSSGRHPDDLLLPYLEGRLAPDETTMVEEHLRTCDECRTLKEQLAETVAVLTANREALCPEPWQLYELVNYGQDPDGSVATHLEQCSACKEIARSVTEKLPSDRIPAQVSHALKAHVAQIATPPSRQEEPRESLLERLYRRYRLPAFSVGLAAAILALVILLPSPAFRSGFLPSSVTWENVPKPKSFGQGMKRAAMVLFVKDSGRTLPQKEVDALYEALAPTMELYQRFQIVSPAQIADLIAKRRYRNDTVSEMVARLHSDLDVSVAALIALQPEEKGTAVAVEIVDAASGAIEAKKSERAVPDSELARTVSATVHSLLLSVGPPEKKP